MFIRSTLYRNAFRSTSGLVWIVVGMVSENRGNGQKTVQRMGAWTCKHVCIGTDFCWCQ